MHHPAFLLRQRATLVIGVLLLCAVASLLFAGMTGSISVPLAEQEGWVMHASPLDGASGQRIP